MPHLDVLPMDGVFKISPTWQKAQTVKQYLGYIDQLGAGQVGRLRPTNGETVHAVRRRLGVAARSCGKSLEIKQMVDEVYFWFPHDNGSKQKKGRRRNTAHTNSS
jgi:hypothetical protein